jgi:YidC/Oxa1 family membrane protein insertase
MQAIQPKINELREKYKDNSQKLNQETAALYKKEGVNPVGGCLPMMLQMPILIALFKVFNRYFGLRGAVFIPGWITDLSVPESIWTFRPISILGRYEFSELHLLPFIYIIIQLFTTYLTQGQAAKAQGSNSMQTKMMTYGLPLMFFFLFYDMPSGLLVYWTMTNLLTLVQQIVVNKLKKNKELKAAK